MTTDFTVSTDTNDVSRGVRVGTLVDFSCWAQPLIDDIRTSAVHWTSSTAFSGIGCPELAASALNHVLGRDCFCFVHGIERDQSARSMLLSHAPATHVHTDILSWLSPTMRSKISTIDADDLRRAILDPRVRLDLHQLSLGSYSFGDCHVVGPPSGFFAHGRGSS